MFTEYIIKFHAFMPLHIIPFFGKVASLNCYSFLKVYPPLDIFSDSTYSLPGVWVYSNSTQDLIHPSQHLLQSIIMGSVHGASLITVPWRNSSRGIEYTGKWPRLYIHLWVWISFLSYTRSMTLLEDTQFPDIKKTRMVVPASGWLSVLCEVIYVKFFVLLAWRRGVAQ